MRKRAGAWTDLLKLMGLVGSQSDLCHWRIKMGLWWQSCYKSLADSPLSLYIQGNVSSSTGWFVVSKLAWAFLLPMILPLFKKKKSSQEYVLRDMLAPGGRPRWQTEAGKGQETAAKIPVVLKMTCSPPSTFEPQTHNEYSLRAKCS